MPKQILPEGEILEQNETHVAVKSEGRIKIYIKGFEFEDLKSKPEYLYSIALDEEDDLFAIFERFDEDNRCNMAELNDEL